MASQSSERQDFGNELDVASKRIGVNIQTLQHLREAFAQIGLEGERADKILTKFREGIGEALVEGTGEANDAFVAMGINIREVVDQGYDLAEIMKVVLDRLNDVQDANRRVNFAAGFFGARGVKALGFGGEFGERYTRASTIFNLSEEQKNALQASRIARGEVGGASSSAFASGVANASQGLAAAFRDLRSALEGAQPATELFAKTMTELFTGIVGFAGGVVNAPRRIGRGFRSTFGLGNTQPEGGRVLGEAGDAARLPFSVTGPEQTKVQNYFDQVQTGFTRALELSKLELEVSGQRAELQRGELAVFQFKNQLADQRIILEEKIAALLTQQEQGMDVDKRQLQDLQEARLDLIMGTDEAIAKVKKLTEQQTANDEATRKITEASAAFEGAFAGAFDQIIEGGAKASDVMKQLLADIIKIALKQAILGPLAENAGSGLGSFFGGAKAGGGSVTGGKGYLVGEMGPELFVPGRSGSIVPNDELSGSPTININVAAGVTREDVVAYIESRRQDFADDAMNQYRASRVQPTSLIGRRV